jgi:hypothetical protein
MMKQKWCSWLKANKICCKNHYLFTFLHNSVSKKWGTEYELNLFEWNCRGTYWSYEKQHLKFIDTVVLSHWHVPMTVATLSEAWTIFTRSNSAVVSSNPIPVIDVCVCLFCVCVVQCVGSCLATRISPSKESYRLFIGFINWKYS